MKMEMLISIIGITLSTIIGVYQIFLTRKVNKIKLDIKKNSSSSEVKNEGMMSGIIGNSNNGDISNNTF